MTKKFKFEDLQPHVDMLCDALENRGASSSGVPNEAVYPFAEKYREVLRQIRGGSMAFETLIFDLQRLHYETLATTGINQRHRIDKIVKALDHFIIKEYNRVNK